MPTSPITSKGQTTVPKEVRDAQFVVFEINYIFQSMYGAAKRLKEAGIPTYW